MTDPTSTITAILGQYMDDPATPLARHTALSELDIGQLDLRMIIIDLEDAFDICIRFDEPIDEFATVGDLFTCVAWHLEAKAAQRARPTAPRARRPWTMTGAEHRR